VRQRRREKQVAIRPIEDEEEAIVIRVRQQLARLACHGWSRRMSGPLESQSCVSCGVNW